MNAVPVGQVDKAPLAKRVAALRRELGFTQQELADYAGLSVSLIHKIEAGLRGRSMRLETFAALARALGVSVAELVGEVPDFVPVSDLAGESRNVSGAETARAVAGNEFAGELGRLMGQRGISHRALARRIHTDAGYVARLVSGRIRPSQEAAELCDKALSAEGKLAALAGSQTLTGAVPPILPVSGAPASGAVISHFGPFRLVPYLNAQLPDLDIAAMQAFRAADLQAGGGNLYASVVSYLNSSVAPRLFGSDGGVSDRESVFAAAGALTEMAGWMAHDAGSDVAANRHFERSVALAEISNDWQLSAHVWGSMSHLASHVNQPDKAIKHARQGRAALRSCAAVPGLEARLFALEARGFALRKDSGKCTAMLHRAEQALGNQQVEPLSPWVSNFDEGSLASEAARCMRQLGDLTEAQRQAQRIIVLRPGNRTRSRAFGQLILASVMIAQGKSDEACAVAQEVINSTQSLGSYLVIRQLLNLKPLLAPYRTAATVADFLSCLNETILERQWLYRWLKDEPK